MVNFLINDSGARQTLPVLKAMLKNDLDDVLLLAQGYIDARVFAELGVENWLEKNRDRVVILLVGVHGKGDLNYCNSNSKEVEKEIETILRKWLLPNDGGDRLLLYAAEHFHAKFAAVGKLVRDKETASAFTIDDQLNLLFSPNEVVFGSSNLTQAALHGPNVELDIHIPRGSSKILGDFSSSMHTVLSRSISMSNDLARFSETLTAEIRGYRDRCLRELACRREQEEQRAMKEYSDQLEKDLMDPDK